MVPYEPSTITNDHTSYLLHIHIMVSCSSNLNFEWMVSMLSKYKINWFFLSKATPWIETSDETCAPGEPLENKTDTSFVLFQY